MFKNKKHPPLYKILTDTLFSGKFNIKKVWRARGQAVICGQSHHKEICHCEGMKRPWQSHSSEISSVIFCSGTLSKRTSRPCALASYRLKKSPLTLTLSRAKVNSQGRGDYINSLKRTYSPIDLLTYSLKKKFAFTLAEVLITLGIIGVVAAMTIPTLIADYRDKEIATRVRKIYSDVNNAILLAQNNLDAVNDNSALFNPNNTSYQTALNFSKYFKGSEACESNTDNKCKKFYYDVKYNKYYTAGGDTGAVNSMWYPAIILSNGAILFIYQYQNPNCYAVQTWEEWDENGKPILDGDGNPVTHTSYIDYCAAILMDVNGNKLPNRYGQDFQKIIVKKDKVEPALQSWEGAESFKNILSGSDEFIYEDYKVGD